MATIERVEQRMEASYDFNNAQDGCKYQITIEEFMELLRNGQLHKGKHTGLFDRFVNWIQQDDFWELAFPMAPELRENKLEESRLANFPKQNAETLFHVQDLLDKLQERIHRPPTAKQVREQEEWVQLCRKAGFTGSLARDDGRKDGDGMGASFCVGKGKGDKEGGKGSADGGGKDGYPGARMMGMGIVVGKPVTLGELVMAAAAAKEKQEGEKKGNEKEKGKGGDS